MKTEIEILRELNEKQGNLIDCLTESGVVRDMTWIKGEIKLMDEISALEQQLDECRKEAIASELAEGKDDDKPFPKIQNTSEWNKPAPLPGDEINPYDVHATREIKSKLQ